jgi:hypothetical protein
VRVVLVAAEEKPKKINDQKNELELERQPRCLPKLVRSDPEKNICYHEGNHPPLN